MSDPPRWQASRIRNGNTRANGQVNVGRDTGTKTEHQAKKKRKPQEPSATRADHAKRQRHRLLRDALPAMRALWQAGVPVEKHHFCWQIYAKATVELAQLDGTLGVLDTDRIGEIARLFGVDVDAVDFLWFVTAAEAEAGHGARHQAAAKALAAGELAVIAHQKIVDLREASILFEKTKERDAALFGRKLVRPARIDPQTGGWAKTKRIFTGMPNVWLGAEAEYTVIRSVPDGPGADRFTTAERKVLCAELGVKIDTLRRREREKTPEEFHRWADRLRKAAATKARKKAEKETRAKRRKRKPGRTAAVRDFALRVGFSERHAFRILKGKGMAEIIEITPRQTLVEIGGYSRASSTPSGKGPTTSPPISRFNVSDMDAAYPAFFDAHVADESQDGTSVPDMRVSDYVSDIDPSRPAFSCSSRREHVAEEAQSRTRKAQLAEIMRAVPKTAVEADRIDRDLGPDSDAWWAVQMMKAGAVWAGATV